MKPWTLPIVATVALACKGCDTREGRRDAAYVSDLDAVLKLWKLPVTAAWPSKIWVRERGPFSTKLFDRKSGKAIDVRFQIYESRGYEMWLLSVRGRVGKRLLSSQDLAQQRFERIRDINPKLFRGLRFQEDPPMPLNFAVARGSSRVSVWDEKNRHVGWLGLDSNGFLKTCLLAP